MPELAEKVQEAVDHLHKAVERQDEEIKRFGVPLQETKDSIAKINEAITSMQAQMADDSKRWERMDEIELKLERQTVVTPGQVSDPEAEAAKAVQKQAFYKYIRKGFGYMTPDEQKALVADTTGQYLMEPDLEAELERTIHDEAIIRPLATVRPIGTDRAKIKSIGTVTVGWGKLETGASVTESEPTPSAPSYAYVEDMVALAKIGNDELEDSEANLEAILNQEFGAAMAAEEDKQFLLGTGHANSKPEGICVDTTLVAATKTTAAAGAVTVEKFMEMIYGVKSRFRKNGVFLWNSTLELAVRQLRAGGSTTTDGPFLWQPSVIAGKPNTFLGHACYTQDDMLDLSDAASCIAVFGDVRYGYRIRDRRGMTVQRLTELYAEAGMTGFLITKRVAGKPWNPGQSPLCLLTEST